MGHFVPCFFLFVTNGLHLFVHIICLELAKKIKDSKKLMLLAEITFENDYFVHKSLGSFVTLEGGEKYYSLAPGLEWTGGETFDDYIR